MEKEIILSAGIDIGTTTTQLVISRLTVSVSRGFGAPPQAEIAAKEIVYQSPVYFTPLLENGDIDGAKVAQIIQKEYAAANDAVMSEVDPQLVKKLGMFEIRTMCKDKFEMLTRPDLGRHFSPETKEYLKQNSTAGADVQIYCGDGLSAPSVGANVPDILPMLTLALEDDSVTVGKPFFVRYCRVNTAREIGPLLGAKVVCVLIGERPGLLTDESMSAYIAYKPRPDMSESDYTVVSNISRFGMPPVEAGAYIAGIIKKMLIQKAGGLSLKL